MKHLIILFCIICTITVNAQVNSDSLWSIWHDENQPIEDQMEAMQSMFFDKFGVSMNVNPDSTISQAELMYAKAERNGLKKWMAKALNNKGIAYNVKGAFKKALDNYNEGEKIAIEIDEKETIGGFAYNKGIIYFRLKDYTNAFPAFASAVSIFEGLGNIRKKALALDKIGVLYAIQQDIPNSLKYLEEALAIREELIKEEDNFKDRFVIAGMKMSIKGMYEQLNDSSTVVIDQEPIPEEFRDDLLKSKDPRSMGFLAAEAEKGGDKKKALEYLDKSLKTSLETGDKISIYGTLNQKINLYLAQKDSIGAIPTLIRANKLAQEEKEYTYIASTSVTLSEIYNSIGQYKNAFKYFQQFIQARDSVLNMENSTALVRLEVQMEYDKNKLKDDLENEKMLAIERQKKKNQQLLSTVIGIGLLLSLILVYIIFSRLKVMRQQKAIIEAQKIEVEQSEQYKEQFLANMSHEIRTPMHAISGMVKILERNEHPASQDEFLQAMHTSADNLVVILNDVLDLSKIEAGKLDIESVPMNPRLVIENVIQILKFKAEEKGLQLNYKIDEEVPKLVLGDPTRLNQILVNLIGNAIKFTEEGRVDISLVKENEQLRYTVQDTGIGIPKNSLDQIFEAFEQGKGSKNGHYGGTGLGLKISKQLTELQEGKIWVESKENEGSTFYVELPLQNAGANAISEDLITEDELKIMATSLQGIRILLVEDNAFNQMIAQDDLSYYIEDLKIDTVENGQMAIDQFNAEVYDLILMDVQMPIMNGFEATKQIRAIEKLAGKGKATPIIAMTASLLKSEINNCYNAGMDNYIPKPYQSNELIGTIYSELHK